MSDIKKYLIYLKVLNGFYNIDLRTENILLNTPWSIVKNADRMYNAEIHWAIRQKNNE